MPRPVRDVFGLSSETDGHKQHTFVPTDKFEAGNDFLHPSEQQEGSDFEDEILYDTRDHNVRLCQTPS